jgi:hypothetical protein
MSSPDLGQAALPARPIYYHQQRLPKSRGQTPNRAHSAIAEASECLGEPLDAIVVARNADGTRNPKVRGVFKTAIDLYQWGRCGTLKK